MGTKRLSRTVIEGGRGHYNQFIRRHSHRRQRAAERRYLRALLLDPTLADAEPEPVLPPVGRWFHDRLAAAERWLASHAGRPWNDVRSELFARFDTRTLAGRHIVYDHLLPPLWRYRSDGRWRVNRRFEFRVDDAGILLVTEWRWRFGPPLRWWLREVHGPRASAEARAFVGDRCVGLRGHHAYWMFPTGTLPDPRRSTQADAVRRHRQGPRLSRADRGRYDRLRPEDRLAISLTLDP